MKIGTHNSLTYHKCQWWVRILGLSFLGKCQSLTIMQQYRMGVRFFDFRIRFDKRGNPYAAHGALYYKDVDFSYIYTFLNQKGDCTVNTILENHFWQKECPGMEFIFRQYIDFLLTTYSKIRFTGGNKKRPWVIIRQLPETLQRCCYEHFEGSKLKIPNPKKYAKRNNRKYWEGVNDTLFSVFDFIEIWQ